MSAQGTLAGIVYPGGHRGEGSGGRAVLVRVDAGGGQRSASRDQRWRPTVRWAAWTARRWAARETRKEERADARRAAARKFTAVAVAAAQTTTKKGTHE